MTCVMSAKGLGRVKTLWQKRWRVASSAMWPTPISAVFSTQQLDPSRTRPSNIITTNLEAFGSQSHSSANYATKHLK
jgi:hypothetical protein